MHPFPLIEALWASIDPEQPSGDDPARVAAALQRFYSDLERAYRQGRLNRWKTDIFKANDLKLCASLGQVKELAGQLALNFKKESPLLDQLKSLDLAVRTSIWELEQEEKSFNLTPTESPKLMQLNYLFEGWYRGALTVEPLENFLNQFLKETLKTQSEIASAINTAKARDKESQEETAAIESTNAGVDALELKIKELLSSLHLGAIACSSLRDAIMTCGQQIAKSYHKLEQVVPLSDPCPFCGGNISLSGRCRSCGRKLPHLEDIVLDADSGQKATPQSAFITNNLRRVDLALQDFEDDADNEDLWREFQEAVRSFAKQIDSGKQHLEMVANSPDRPIDPDSSERQAEAELTAISAVFITAARLLAQFAFQPFPPEGDLPEGWQEPLLEVEPRLKALEAIWAPAQAEEPEPHST